LLKGNSFTFLYTISSNKLRIKTYTLINIKVNGYAFINTKFVALATRFLNTKTQQLLILCNIRGFDSKIAQLITDYIKLTLLINRRQIKVFILVIRLRGQDIILSRK
jgi:hypothetical protein